MLILGLYAKVLGFRVYLEIKFMSVLPIITVPNPLLKQTAQKVETITPQIKKLAHDMVDTMYEAPGVGLASNQIGELYRIFVMDAHYQKDNPATRKPQILINPEIIWKSEEPSVIQEGCLSIPQQFADVERPKIVRVQYLDINGVNQEFEAHDFESHVIQHELDHLNGVLFIDHLSRLKRSMILRKLDKLRRESSIL